MMGPLWREHSAKGLPFSRVFGASHPVYWRRYGSPSPRRTVRGSGSPSEFLLIFSNDDNHNNTNIHNIIVDMLY